MRRPNRSWTHERETDLNAARKDRGLSRLSLHLGDMKSLRAGHDRESTSGDAIVTVDDNIKNPVTVEITDNGKRGLSRSDLFSILSHP